MKAHYIFAAKFAMAIIAGMEVPVKDPFEDLSESRIC